MKKHLIVFTMMIFFISSCKQEESPEESPGKISARKIKIVATSNQVLDLVSNIGGNRVNAEGLLGTGVDPHLYRASEGDVVKMYNADMIFYNGLHLEGRMEDVFKNMKGKTKVYAVTDGIPKERLISSDGHGHAYDPHVWLNVQLWKLAAEYVKEKMIQYDSLNRKIYNKNYNDYAYRLDTLDHFIKMRINEIPEDKRYLITAHDAFNYFGKAYGIEVAGLQGISTETKAGTKDVQRLASFIIEHDIPAVFVEASVPEKSIIALREAVRAKGYNTENGRELYTDSLANPGTFQGTYIGMMTYNVNKIVSALTK